MGLLTQQPWLENIKPPAPNNLPCVFPLFPYYSKSAGQLRLSSSLFGLFNDRLIIVALAYTLPLT